MKNKPNFVVLLTAIKNMMAHEEDLDINMINQVKKLAVHFLPVNLNAINPVDQIDIWPTHGRVFASVAWKKGEEDVYSWYILTKSGFTCIGTPSIDKSLTDILVRNTHALVF